MDEVVAEFLVESNEALDQMDLDFLALEKGESGDDTLASVFRAIHTIKGTCGFLGYNKLESLTHVGETLLGRMRDGDLAVTPEIVTALLSLSDAVREMLGCIEQAGNDGEAEYSELATVLTRLQDGGDVEAPAGEPPAQAAEPAAASAEPEAVAEPVAEEPVATEPGQDAEVASEPVPANVPAADARTASVAERTVRVDVGLLDSLMNQVGELVLARNQILQYSISQDDPVFLTTTQRLNLITTELQEDVMKTRMQPIGTIWNKFPRVIRDLARSCDKKVRIEMEGEETELDRTIIEAIKDPLTHVIRNAVDHGVEMPAERAANGKPEEGCVWLRAYHEGGHVNIEITDDGAGIDVERVKDKAVRNHCITAEQANRMNDREALNLIFSPGLSTAKAVTNISGRGVGMDVVKTNIEKIGGAVDIQSTPGSGSTLRIKIPLTLAIIPALIITSDGDSYAIPQVSLVELVRLDGERACSAIEMIHDVPVYRLRGNLLPIVWLNEQLGLAPPPDLVAEDEPVLNIAVLQAEDRQFGLVVDEVNDNQEIVVKPLDKLLSGLTSYAGATIMGDGRVALILDALGLATQAGVVSQIRGDASQAGASYQAGDGLPGRETLLLFTGNGSDRFAVPLSRVARLEEFERDVIEQAGSCQVVQYRGELMPLVRLADVLGFPGPDDGTGSIQVVVYNGEHSVVGIVVHEILDILDEEIEVRERVTRTGVVGTAVVQGKVTEILDLDQVVEMAGYGPALAGCDA